MPRRGINRVPTGDGSELFAMAMENEASSAAGGPRKGGKKGDKNNKDEKDDQGASK